MKSTQALYISTLAFVVWRLASHHFGILDLLNIPQSFVIRFAFGWVAVALMAKGFTQLINLSNLS